MSGVIAAIRRTMLSCTSLVRDGRIGLAVSALTLTASPTRANELNPLLAAFAGAVGIAARAKRQGARVVRGYRKLSSGKRRRRRHARLRRQVAFGAVVRKRRPLKGPGERARRHQFQGLKSLAKRTSLRDGAASDECPIR